MPSLQDATGQDLSAYVPAKASPQSSLPPTQDQAPTLNTMIRCPLPPIFQAEPDSLRQFYQGGKVPQNRIFAPSTNTISGGSGNTTVNTTVFNSSGGGGSTPATPTTSQQAVITTPILGPGATFTVAVTKMSRSFQLLNVSSNVAARFEMYGTAAAQLADISRALDTPPPAGSAQGIITDVALDTSPFLWNFQNRVGANGDVPQNPEAFVTITNLSLAAVAITVTIQFFPLET